MSNGICLITGASGFLGSEIVRQAAASRLVIRATDKIIDFKIPGVDYRPADILELSSSNSLFKDVTQVIHAAGLAHISNASQAVTAPFEMINGQGTQNICRAAAEAGVEHFILVSSVSVYGPSAKGICDESTACFPEGPYAESKFLAEQYAIRCAQQSGMALTILRLATIFGERDPGNVARLMRTIDKGRFIWIGNGSNLKSLLYRGDAARACLVVASHAFFGIKMYNVSAPPCMMREVVEGLAKTLGRHIPCVHLPANIVLRILNIFSKLSGNHNHLRDMRSTLIKWLADDAFDASKFQQTSGFQTQIGLTEGLRREVSWYRGEIT